ncbi:Uncharacterised protein [Vibrio cholerae]|nr:Uncharacterised protein [Vibrio cholerae]CSC39871.1 Uncharacterised protein [Vibrio cholerae]CSC76988.1 Uncharacterised protein [Vibrio cholerae]
MRSSSSGAIKRKLDCAVCTSPRWRWACGNVRWACTNSGSTAAKVGAVTTICIERDDISSAAANPSALVFPRPRSAVSTKGRLRCPVTTLMMLSIANLCSV